MFKFVSDVMEMSARKRKIHVLHGLLEYMLIITIALIAIITTSIILAEQITNLSSHNDKIATSISTLLSH